MFIHAEFEKFPVVAILRGVSQVHVPALARVITESEIPAVEITMNTENAGHIIADLRNRLPDSVSVGAGTVLSLSALEDALHAGAEFVVMPTIEKDICEYCHANKIPFFPGALTPNEVLTAWRCGATMVKIFPVKFFGPDYIKELKGPLNHVKLLACGGVNAGNVAGYRRSGADAFAIGGSAIPKEKLNEDDYPEIVRALKELKEAWDNGAD